MTADSHWENWALQSRAALEALGCRMPECLPGERQHCGMDYQGHALANLAALAGIAEHRVTYHMTGNDRLTKFERFRDSIAEEMSRICGHSEDEAPARKARKWN